MKSLKLIFLTLTTIVFFGMGNVNAQEKSTVIITTITSGNQITLQVVDDQNNTTSQKLRFSAEKPEQACLKVEMDNWIKKGYEIKQSYGYASPVGAGNIRYETIILSK